VEAGVKASTRARIDEFWAQRLGSGPVELVRSPGLHLVVHPAPNAFFVLGREASVVAVAPPALHARLAALGPERVLDRAALLEVLPAGARCIGPTFVGYLDVAPGAPSGRVVELPDTSGTAFESLRARASGEEWQHAGLERAAAPLFAVVENGEVRCAAGAEILLGSVAHIGVLTHPDARGRGLARDVVAALTRHSLARGLLAQYQTLMSNAPSLAVGKALGFERFATTFGGSWKEEPVSVEPIFHLTPESELRSGLRGEGYWPAGFAADGFVHCSGTPEIVLAVARAYYASVAEPLLVLRIEPPRLTSRLLFEPGAPPVPPGIAQGTLFPHVYGPIDRAAISGVGALERRADELVWPSRFEPLK
jgi:uncharacterized protein (DUF952 family)/GNAT superfamily N-acetyltransferase